VGDPYVEIDWSRSFGKFRPSKYARAAPILEGLTILAGFGVVFPAGTYNASDPTQQALSIGNSTWDFAPTFGHTYTTPPILAEGTEISVRFFWNNYLENPTTHYSAGDLLDLEFALTERIGRFQVGAAGFYFWHRRTTSYSGLWFHPTGGVPRFFNSVPSSTSTCQNSGSSVKLKALSTLIAENNVRSFGMAFWWIKKF
jgi:hypothetical protein